MVSHKLQIQREKKKMKHESEQNPTKTARFSKTHTNMYMLPIYVPWLTHTDIPIIDNVRLTNGAEH